MIGPAPILAVIVGLFHVSAYVFIRGRAGARLPMLVVAAILGALGRRHRGRATGHRSARIGDFHLLSASFVAWLGIGLVAILAVLVPERPAQGTATRVSTTLKRSKSEPIADPEPEAPSA